MAPPRGARWQCSRQGAGHRAATTAGKTTEVLYCFQAAFHRPFSHFSAKLRTSSPKGQAQPQEAGSPLKQEPVYWVKSVSCMAIPPE